MPSKQRPVLRALWCASIVLAMQQIDLEPDQYVSTRKPHRLSPKARVGKLVFWTLPFFAAFAWAAATSDQWWAVFTTWPFVFVYGGALGYVAPEFFFNEED